jgi:hypothetical protein
MMIRGAPTICVDMAGAARTFIVDKGYTPNLYAPHLPEVATSSEVRTLKEMVDLKQIDHLASTVRVL